MIVYCHVRKGFVMSFDLAVSRAVTMAHALEKALHDHDGPWTIELGDQIVPAARFVGESVVLFTAYFPYIAEEAVPLLRSGGEYVYAAAPVEASEVPGEYRLELSLATGVSA